MVFTLLSLLSFGTGWCYWYTLGLPSNLWYKVHQIQKLECFLSRLGVVFAQSIEVRCWVENEDVVGAVLTGDAPTTSEWSTILLPTKVQLILEVWQYVTSLALEQLIGRPSTSEETLDNIWVDVLQLIFLIYQNYKFKQKIQAKYLHIWGDMLYFTGMIGVGVGVGMWNLHGCMLLKIMSSYPLLSPRCDDFHVMILLNALCAS